MLRCLPEPLVDDIALRAIRCTIKKAIGRGWFRPAEFEDLIQDAIVQLLQKMDHFDPCRSSWPTFCSLITTNYLSSTHSRRCRRAPVDSLPEQQDAGLGTEQIEDRHSVGRRYVRTRSQYEWLDLNEDVTEMIDGLPDQLREVCESYLVNQNVSDVAASLGVSRNTVYRRRQMIRESTSEMYMDEYR